MNHRVLTREKIDALVDGSGCFEILTAYERFIKLIDLETRWRPEGCECDLCGHLDDRADELNELVQAELRDGDREAVIETIRMEE